MKVELLDDEEKLVDVFGNAFWIGFLITILLFIILNVHNFLEQQENHKLRVIKSNDFSNELGPNWGFPFSIPQTGGSAEALFFCLNILTAFISAFIIGLIFRFIWQKAAKK